MRRRSSILVFAVVLFALAPAASQAAFPGANGKLVFSSARDGDSDIYTINPDGTGLTQRTNDPGNDSNPAWSADGTKIAFQKNDPVDYNRAGIWMMNADGSGQTQLNFDARIGYTDPAWSPDGQQIAFHWNERCNDGGLFVMNADGTGAHRVSCQLRFSGGASWSPDGGTIVWHASLTGFDNFIYSVSPSGGPTTSPTGATYGYESHPNWSPSGQKLVLNRSEYSEGGHTGIFTMNPEGSSKTWVEGTGPGDRYPVWSPDSTKIAFIRDQTGIWTMNLDGTGQTPVPGAEDALSFDWQPASAPLEADLAVTKFDSTDPVRPGAPLTYTITVANAGSLTAEDVTVGDPVSRTARIRAVTASKGSCRVRMKVVRCRLGDLSGGESATVTIVVRPKRAGTLVNSATAATASPEPNTENNTGTATTTVVR